MAVCFLLCFLAFLSRQAVLCSPTLSDILKQTSQALSHKDVEDVHRILNEHFFTTEKEKSVWYMAFVITKKEFNIHPDLEDLTRFQITIQRLKRWYTTCRKSENKNKKCKCYAKFVDLLKDGKRDFVWSIKGSKRLGMRAKMSIFYSCYVTVSMQLAFIASSEAKECSNERESLSRKFSDLLERMMVRFIHYEGWLTEWRQDQVSPVTTCETKSYFWVSFEVNCETRLTRSEVEYPADEDEEPLNNEADIDAIVEKIGGVNDYRHVHYTSTVEDQVTGKVLFKRNITVDNASRGAHLQKLFEEGIAVRKNKTAILNERISQLHDDTIKIVRNIVNIGLKVLY